MNNESLELKLKDKEIRITIKDAKQEELQEISGICYKTDFPFDIYVKTKDLKLRYPVAGFSRGIYEIDGPNFTYKNPAVLEAYLNNPDFKRKTSKEMSELREQGKFYFL